VKYKIENTKRGTEINISNVETPAEQKQLMDAFQECQNGTCSCPTNEYQKLEKMEIQEGNGLIVLNLMPKSGQELDQSEIARCLEYTKSKVEEKK
jgi:hypothetical protein